MGALNTGGGRRTCEAICKYDVEPDVECLLLA